MVASQTAREETDPTLAGGRSNLLDLNEDLCAFIALLRSELDAVSRELEETKNKKLSDHRAIDDNLPGLHESLVAEPSPAQFPAALFETSPLSTSDRFRRLNSLRHNNSPIFIAELVFLFDTFEEDSLRAEILESLETWDQALPETFFLARLNDPSPQVRIALTRLLARHPQSPRLMKHELLERLQKDKHPSVARRARFFLHQLPWMPVEKTT